MSIVKAFADKQAADQPLGEWVLYTPNYFKNEPLIVQSQGDQGDGYSLVSEYTKGDVSTYRVETKRLKPFNGKLQFQKDDAVTVDPEFNGCGSGVMRVLTSVFTNKGTERCYIVPYEGPPDLTRAVRIDGKALIKVDDPEDLSGGVVMASKKIAQGVEQIRFLPGDIVKYKFGKEGKVVGISVAPEYEMRGSITEEMKGHKVYVQVDFSNGLRKPFACSQSDLEIVTESGSAYPKHSIGDYVTYGVSGSGTVGGIQKGYGDNQWFYHVSDTRTGHQRLMSEQELRTSEPDDMSEVVMAAKEWKKGDPVLVKKNVYDSKTNTFVDQFVEAWFDSYTFFDRNTGPVKMALVHDGEHSTYPVQATDVFSRNYFNADAGEEIIMARKAAGREMKFYPGDIVSHNVYPNKEFKVMRVHEYKDSRSDVLYVQQISPKAGKHGSFSMASQNCQLVNRENFNLPSEKPKYDIGQQAHGLNDAGQLVYAGEIVGVVGQLNEWGSTTWDYKIKNVDGVDIVLFERQVIIDEPDTGGEMVMAKKG
jgi:hypothetical protein